MNNPAEDTFFGHAWYEQVAKALGASYLDRPKQKGLRFGVSGLSVVYPIFPSGLHEYDEDSLLALVSEWKGELWGASLLRFCTFIDLEKTHILDGRTFYRIQDSTVTRISALQDWSKLVLPSSLQRNLKRACKLGVSIRDATLDDTDAVFKLYQTAVERNSGALRYTRAYFEALLSGNHSDLRCMLACVEGECVAMNIAAFQGKQAFYLHGGFVGEFSEYRAPDLLMFTAIEWAKKKGAESFDFMSSPSSQAGLIKYKEKWGGESRPQYTVDICRSRFSLYVFDMVMKGLELKRKIYK
ncbi:GNAT family N-acetyltransferase [Pseudoteredinibacter isoporae]|uniref:BioF2-like acetyltransferase domain-containing protein n=1 Tax=Pseudoteredinibacter isoporae TaxID=570281 RepID=A0A7X0MWQ4_9GAMM|nr:GNAT family N-acetyltransferase [Pseudoteredinibacter isoporae]MBB6522708.1 hypothetical protein [Pseudoteredinibacter isoporae]NHO88238.1 GNAT family N-acetyltransferase [Pseudoteredinibacter isoporae]NIB23431.1 GNAT family N-acetyltransferase [Pseudoteredinibacter isoporae]